MYYFYDYSVLEETIKKHYEGLEFKDAIEKLTRESHLGVAFKLKMVLVNRSNLTQNEINALATTLKLNGEQIQKCFFNVVKSFETRDEFITFYNEVMKKR